MNALLLRLLAAVLLGSAAGWVQDAMALPMTGLPMGQAPLLVSSNAETVPNEYIVIFKDRKELIPEPPAGTQPHSDTDREEEATFLATAWTDRILSEPVFQMDDEDEPTVLLHRYENGFAVRLRGGREMMQLDALRMQKEVAWVEPNQVINIRGVQMSPPSWGLARIYQREFRVRDVYKFPDSAGEDVDVYVIDTGINIEHEDFEDRAEWGTTIPYGDKDEDGNGHGTHVASTIAGKMYGVAKKANVIAVKVLSSSGYGTIADVMKGVEWAAKKAKSQKKRSVANMSLGGGRSYALDLAVINAVKSGLAFSVAAGNSNADACSHSPAAVESAVTVGASTVSDARAYFSNTGKCVDLFAPGESITAAWIGSRSAVQTISGTSMAAPHVAGVMALFLADHDYTPQELKEKLVDVSTEDALTGVPEDTVNLLLNNDADSSDTLPDKLRVQEAS